eukprot:TRINITY_DN1205_c0_g1_i6.p2 TRINITY_DN1205_c0_g1~~TRINITY_DN1205_c0_g1_i6.p2  ORF type:complete len:200 (+),score=-8.79 TRINITY_DN1205_c0_g1_i6:517-1116(+)
MGQSGVRPEYFLSVPVRPGLRQGRPRQGSQLLKAGQHHVRRVSVKAVDQEHRDANVHSAPTSVVPVRAFRCQLLSEGHAPSWLAQRRNDSRGEWLSVRSGVKSPVALLDQAVLESNRECRSSKNCHALFAQHVTQGNQGEANQCVWVVTAHAAHQGDAQAFGLGGPGTVIGLSLIHISEPTRLGMISYAVFCLKKKKKK